MPFAQFLSATLITLSASVTFAASKFVCVNKTNLQTKFELQIDQNAGALLGASTKCKTQLIPYRPNSPKYEGWIRFAPLASEKGCKNFHNQVVGKPYDGDTADIHWLSISKEMQAGAEGFAQLGVENTADPGAGGTAKIFVRCFPK